MSTSNRWIERFSSLFAPPGRAALRRPVAPSPALGRVLAPPPMQASRRGVLRGALGGAAVTVGLPWLELFVGPTARAETTFPIRFGVWNWGNGVRPDQWRPVGEGSGLSWTLSEELAPLINVKEKLAVVTGMAVKVPNYIPHWSGAGGLLTGLDALGDDEDWTVQGPTIDHIVADQIGGATIYKSLEIGLDTNEIFSFTGPNARAPGETDPFTLYERIFGATFREPGEGGVVDPRLGYRRSALDAVMQDVHALQRELGAADRLRLEAHLDGVRALEQRLARLQEDPPDLEACTRPVAPEVTYPDIDGRVQISARAQAMHEVLAMALACDQTRVFNFMLSRPVANLMFPGSPDGHHNLTHDEPSPQPEVHEITVQIITELAYFLERLDSIPEGDGTLLDHAAILCCSEHGEARTHAITDMPIVVAGSAGGRLVNDVHYRSYTDENVGKVVLSMLRAMGVSTPSWGDGDTFTEDGLSAIEV
ncbi:MAG: hypothetical protein RL071_1339 [Pseudomonadota bacterium]